VRPATPYQLKQLAEAGLLDERREEGGRRRRTYRVSKAGRKALREWRADPQTDLYELRDPGLLKLFCGADPAALAETQLERHERRHHSYEELLEGTDMPEGMRLALESGIGHEREYVRFWSRLRDGGKG
jgi:PadR family transcriptional regulator AphA